MRDWSDREPCGSDRGIRFEFAAWFGLLAFIGGLTLLSL